MPLNANLQNSSMFVDSLVQEIYAKPKDLNNPSLQPNPIICDHVHLIYVSCSKRFLIDYLWVQVE